MHTPDGPPTMTTKKRSQKIIQPGFQLRLVGLFTGMGMLALLLQFSIVGFRLSQAVADVEESGGHIADQIPGVLMNTIVFSLGMLVPVLFGFGILLTFRIAGPAYRMEQYLRAVARGEAQGPCSIRKGDQLRELCDAINLAVESLQQKSGATSPESAPADQTWQRAA